MIYLPVVPNTSITVAMFTVAMGTGHITNNIYSFQLLLHTQIPSPCTLLLATKSSTLII